MYGEWMTLGLLMTGKVPSHRSVLMVSYVKAMTLKPIQYSIFGLAHILNVANVTFQAIYEIVALIVPMHYGITDMV